MESGDFSNLMLKLLPRGNWWQFEKSSIFFQIIKGVAAEFSRIHDRLNDTAHSFFPHSPSTLWKESLLFSAREKLFNLSQESINAQLDFYNIKNTEIITPIDEPFILYIHINSSNEHYFSAGDEVGMELYHWKDEKLEARLSDILPAFCQQNMIYRSNEHA